MVSHACQFACEQTTSIDRTNWIRVGVGVQIQAAFQPNYISLHVAPDTRIVIPEVVIREIGLPIEILPRESQREIELYPVSIRVVIRRCCSEGLLLSPPPHDLLGFVGDE